MADLEPIGPMIPALPPSKGKGDRRKSDREDEKPNRDDGDQSSGADKRKPDDSTHQVDEYA